MDPRRRRGVPVPVGLAAALLLSGCAGDSTGSAGQSAGAASSPGSDCALVVSDAWVKAADSGMTAAFGTITNGGADEEVVTSATSDAAGRMEIHEVVDVDGAMVMRPKDGGLVIAAGASATLAPGGDHLMLMELPAPIEPGVDVSIVLQCRDGGTAAFTAVAKPFEGAAEDYQPGMESMDDGSMQPAASGSADEGQAGASPSPSAG